MEIERLSDESTGECPCGCGEAAYAYWAEGLDGYVDAAPGCAEEHVRAALGITEDDEGSSPHTERS